MNKPHIEIENMDGHKSAHLHLNGWVDELVNGEVVYSHPKAFGAKRLCLSDAFQLQTIFDKWAGEANE